MSDDCLILCKGTKQAARNIKHILERYCKILGQLVNYHKSKILFSKGIENSTKKNIIDILQITSSIGTYLGCSNWIRENRQRTSRVQDLLGRMRVGRLVLFLK